MSKTRKVRRARKAREAALLAKLEAEHQKNKVLNETADIRRKWSHLLDLCSHFPSHTLAKALVFGSINKGRVDRPHFECPRMEVDPRCLTARMDYPMVSEVSIDRLEALAIGLEQNMHGMGHCFKAELGGKPVFFMDAECIKHIPEQMLVVELAEVFAEQVKLLKE